MWFTLVLLVSWLASSKGQGQPMSDAEIPPGLRAWLEKADLCSTPRWVVFYEDLSGAVNGFQTSGAAATLSRLTAILAPIVRDPFVAFDCATAVASALLLGAQCSEHLQLPLLSARFRQLAAVFSSFDYQMKGEEYLDQSPWPIHWMESMDGILRAMTNLKHHEHTLNPLQRAPLRRVLETVQLGEQARRQRIAIVSVCDYNAATTPLARLSRINKERYAALHGYDVIMHDKAPTFKDPLSSYFTEPSSHRPPAWSKVDAMLMALSTGKYDWIFWMDCDSFFMDLGVPLESVALAADQAQCGQAQPQDSVAGMMKLVKDWLDGPPASGTDRGDLLEWYDNLIESHWANRASSGDRVSDPCTPCKSGDQCLGPGTPPVNRTLGWNQALFSETQPHIIASEDGLMLNTGIMLVRASAWSWQFFQKVRGMTFGRSPVTQHPWWEQTAMVYLLQLPFTLFHAAAQQVATMDLGSPGRGLGYAPALFLTSQKHLNGYPKLVATALKTHEEFVDDDFIVSFSGCKVFSTQDVCNQLFMMHFFKVHDFRDFEHDPVLSAWL